MPPAVVRKRRRVGCRDGTISLVSQRWHIAVLPEEEKSPHGKFRFMPPGEA
jgi:hypothetical protein